MKLLIYLLLLLTMPLAAQGKTDEKTLLDRIDKMIENDQYYQGIKEKELKHLKRQAYEAEDNQTRLLFLDSIYHAYSAYRYDSAYAYMKQGLELAEKCHNTYYILRNQINQASILSVRGFYSKAENILKSLNPDEMPYQLKLYYYFTYAWLYSYWESYSKNSDYAEEFRAQKKHYMTLLIQSFNENNKHNVFYQYLMGEYAYLHNPTSKESLNYYLKALKMSPAKSRIHAMSAYGIARYYKKTGKFDLYEEFLVEASVSDGLCQLKETVALQKLAYYIFKKDASNSKRAAKYIPAHDGRCTVLQQPTAHDGDFEHPSSHRFSQPAGCRALSYPLSLGVHWCKHSAGHHPYPLLSQQPTEEQAEEKQG